MKLANRTAGLCITVGIAAIGSWLIRAAAAGNWLELAGVTVTPHVRAEAMRYRQPVPPDLAARVQLFLRNTDPQARPLRFDAGSPLRFDGRTPAQCLESGDWSWHDTPHAVPNGPLELPAGALTVWTINGKSARWGIGQSIEMEVAPSTEAEAVRLPLAIEQPTSWLSAVTFLSGDGSVYPDRLIAWIQNNDLVPLRITGCRLWLPKNNASRRVLFPQEALSRMAKLPANGVVPAKDKGALEAYTGRLPLTYAAVEVTLADPRNRHRTLWAHLRVKQECFDISGGWVSGTGPRGPHLADERFLKTLKRLRVNTAHIANTPGYTDHPELYGRYPLKYFHALRPFETYDNDDMLPRIHAVEFLGEPQYGGGRPVAPQAVWEKLAPYAATRLPTSLTNSEERVWRWYAGLSDYPHYDAYRVSAPAADAWRQYERWGDQRIGWGAPLETIGDMCRSMRELSRPSPTAYWSQGPHQGWGVIDGRKRTSPTPDEIRLQAYHALSSRITSLYWFNLSLKSLLKFRDTWDELTRIGREIRTLEEFYVRGDAYRYERILREGKPDWDLASIVSPRGALLFALDLDYHPDPAEKVFRFGLPRQASWSWALPPWLRRPSAVFRFDADGISQVKYQATSHGITLTDTASKVAVYVVAADSKLRGELMARLKALREEEEALGFDPAKNDQDFAALKELLDDKKP